MTEQTSIPSDISPDASPNVKQGTVIKKSSAKIKRSKNSAELRSGFTTGACAAAASRAAAHYLLTGNQIEQITITLPIGEQATFKLARLQQTENGVLAGIIKDAGDDPDCTHGAEIQSLVTYSQQAGIRIDGGVGVAKVTLPGLELPVGMAAINPVPRKNILQMVEKEWHLRPATIDKKYLGLSVEIRVPNGVELAKQTIAERLGLIGGISILGTRGTVKPYSTSAFASSVRQAIQVATTNQTRHLVLTTGSRTEKAAKTIFPELSGMSFIQAGDFVGVGLRSARRYQAEQVSIVVMVGKLCKMVAGHLMTHVSGEKIDFNLLSKLANEIGSQHSFSQKIAAANTGRHLLQIYCQQPLDGYLDLLCKQAKQHASAYIDQQLPIEFYLVDFDGQLIASSDCS